MEKLPEELLWRICRNLDRAGDVQKLALVNKKWARIATPLLYERISLDQLPYKEQVGAQRQLLSTLISSPTSRPLVRRLDISNWRIFDIETDVGVAPTSLTDFTGIIQCLPALLACPIDFQRKFGVNLLQSSLDAMLTAILNLLPDLASLSLAVNCWAGLPERDGEETTRICLDFDEALSVRLVRFSTTQSLASYSILKSLRWVSISEDIFWDNDTQIMGGWDTNIISFFLRLPTLNTFIGRGCYDTNNGSTWDCEERASSVTNINLYSCRLGAEALRKILRACQALETFTCDRICLDCFGRRVSYDYDSSYAGVHHELYHHRESLTSLHLFSRSCEHSRNDEPLETLSALNSLSILKADQSALFRNGAPRGLSEFFPSNLSEITFLGEDEEWQNEMLLAIGRTLLSDVDASLPAIDFKKIRGIEVDVILQKLPGIALEETSDRESGGSYNVRMRKIEVEKDSVESVNYSL